MASDDVAAAIYSIAGVLTSGEGRRSDTRLAVSNGSSASVLEFIQTPSCLVLRHSVSRTAGPAFQTGPGLLTSGPNSSNCTYFIKKRATPIVEASHLLDDITVVSSSSGLLQGLYASVHNAALPGLSEAVVAGSLSTTTSSASASIAHSKLRASLQDLDRSLAERLRSLGASGSPTAGGASGPDDAATAVDSDESEAPRDELLYCARLMELSGRHSVRASAFEGLLQPLVSKLEALPSSSLHDAAELLDDVTSAVDALWRMRMPPGCDGYPSGRMRRLLELVGRSVCECAAGHAARYPLLSGPPGYLEATLAEGARLCDDWSLALSRLTAGPASWASVPWRPWVDGPVEDAPTAQLCARLTALKQARQLWDAASALSSTPGNLATGGATTMSCGSSSLDATDAAARLSLAFKPLASALSQPGVLLAMPQSQWERLMADHERAVVPVEALLTSRVRASLSQAAVAGATSGAHALHEQLSSVSAVLLRPGVMKATATERFSLLSSFNREVDALEAELARRSRTVATRLVLSQATVARSGEDGLHVTDVIWARGAQSRLSALTSSSTLLLADVPGASGFGETLREVSDKLASHQAAVFAHWAASYEAALRSGTLSLDAAGPLMGFDGAGNMDVRFPPLLGSLLHDSRRFAELSEAGAGASRGASKDRRSQAAAFSIPERLRAAAAEGGRFYRYAVDLSRIASCYNSLGAEILPCQKPLLLEPLLAFERLVSDSAGEAAASAPITWRDGDRVASYLTQLQAAADAVASANRELRASLSHVEAQVGAVSGCDMVKDRLKWKGALSSYRDTLEGSVAGRQPSHTAPWLTHCGGLLHDAVLESFTRTLEGFHSSLPEIRVELVYSLASSEVTFRPGLPELSTTYQRELKRHVAAPAGVVADALTFDGGHGPNPELTARFAGMASAYSDAVKIAQQRAESLFGRLRKLRDALQPWMALDSAAKAIDSGAGTSATDAKPSSLSPFGDEALESFVEARVGSLSDYEANFASVRSRRREAERIPDLHRVDCVTVNAGPLKRAIDGLLQRLFDALLLSLRRRTSSSLVRVEEYLATGAEEMARPLGSMADITESQSRWRELTTARAAMVTASLDLGHQRRLLSSACVGAAFDVSDIEARIARLPSLWDRFDSLLDAFTASLESQRESLRGGVNGSIEDVRTRGARLAQRWAALRPTQPRSWSQADVDAVFASLSDWQAQLKALQDSARAVTENCASFGLEKPTIDGLAALEADIAVVCGVWERYRDYNAARSSLAAQDWISFRGRVFELQDFASKWGDAAAASQPATTQPHARPVPGAPADPVSARMASETGLLRRAFGGLKFARGDGFREEHWGALGKQLGLPKGTSLETLTVGHFLGALEAIVANTGWLKELHSRAQGEVAIREALGEVRAWAETAVVKLTEHTSPASGAVTPLVRDWKEVVAAIGDNQSLLASLKDSPHFRPFAETVAALEVQLATLDGVCLALSSLQRRWVYLEPVFARDALPSEQPRFRRVDDHFRGTMRRIHADSRLISLADAGTFPNLREQLSSSLDTLERCQRALAEFLEERRAAFPRFHFVGDDDLLEVLGQAHRPEVVQAHLRKLFQGVHSVLLSEESGNVQQAEGATGAPRSITAVVSALGETLHLRQPVGISADVTGWLTQLEGELSGSLATLLARYLALPPESPWTSRLAAFPSQIHCLGEQILFTRAVEAALQAGPKASGALSALRVSLERSIASYTAHDVAGSPLAAAAVRALVMDAVHHLDVVDQLASKDVRSASSWGWQKQLRLYAEGGGKTATGAGGVRVVARMVDACVEYGFEYQGNAPRLVHTPLTDKCYLVLTQALAHGYGGNPYGPAGTGKTESVKALGAAVGRQVLVFNSDEGMDHASMGRILAGIVRCGAWGCFDEFNRLREDQLSAVSQQVQAIQDALKGAAPSVRLLGRDVPLNPHAGIFVTLNPAGKGYGGRYKLPDNLSQLFRPVAMTAPDFDVIAEVTLQAEGFTAARELGRRAVTVFHMASQLLAHKQHYDWGLRALKVVLNTAGSLLQRARTAAAAQGGAANGTPIPITRTLEAELLVKALRVNTLSKLGGDDSARFLALVADVFPGSPGEDLSDSDLEGAIRDVMASPPFSLQHDPRQVRQILQLREALDQRIGCVVVGTAGAGKSTLWRVLAAALGRLGVRVVTHVLNPKAMPRSRLLGWLNHDTREWTDGVLTAAARAVVREPPGTRSLIVCDGDVDPEWVEALNSVLDDNRLLTLPNGERIAFGPGCAVNFLFETHDLSHASPATVSRMGMVFLAEEDVQLTGLVRSWVAAQPEADRAALGPLIEGMLYRALDWVRAQPASLVGSTLLGTLSAALSHLQGCTTRPAFALALTRGLGGNLPLASREALARHIASLAGLRLPDPACPLDVTLDASGEGLAPLVLSDASAELSRADLSASALVMTPSVRRTAAVLQPWMDRGDPVLLVGPDGAGKSALVRQLAASRPSTSLAVLHCTAQTTAEHVVAKLRVSCALQSSGNGRVLRPRTGDRLVLLLQDVHLPAPDRYGTCSLVALLQQLLAHRGFFDEAREFINVERVQVVATLSQSSPGASTNGGAAGHPLSSRFTGAVRVAGMEYPPSSELVAVYAAYLTAVFGPRSGSDPRVSAPADLARLAALMVDVYDAVSALASRQGCGHYRFSPRDLTAWVSGLLRYDTSSESLLDCAVYEARRIFRDRLVDEEAQLAFDGAVSTALRTHFQASVDVRDAVFTSLGAPPAAAPASDDDGASVGSRLSRLPRSDFRSLVQHGLVQYEREERELGLVLTDDTIATIAAVDRALSQPRGHVLMIGPSGRGKRSAVALVAHMQGAQLLNPPTGREYGLKAFAADVKAALSTAAIKNVPVVLLIEERHVAQDPRVLEVANALLSAGEAPGLYEQAEYDQLLGPLKEAATAAPAPARGGTVTPHDIFLQRIRANLHVCLSQDPSAPGLTTRCDRNPALVTRSTLLWLGDWGHQPMREVASGVAAEFLRDACGSCSGDLPPDALLDAVLAVHQSQNAPPRALRALLRVLRSIHASQAAAHSADSARLSAGLSKLLDAHIRIDELTRDAQAQRESLTVKQAAADAAMNEITLALASASDRRREVEGLQAQLREAQGETQARKGAIEAQLAGVQPILDAARAAVGGIRKEHLDEIRSLKTPPEAIADVLGAVLAMLGERDTSWLAMKKFLAGRGVKEEILSFDAPARLTPDVLSAVQKVVRAKQDSFDRADAVSKAAGPLAAWVRANVTYGLALVQVAPLQRELDAANAHAASAQAAVSDNQAELANVDIRVAALKAEFAARTGEAEVVRQALEKTQDTLRRAQALLTDLSGERVRWKARLDELALSSASLPVHALLAAAFVTYAGRMSECDRTAVVGVWRKLVTDTITPHASKLAQNARDALLSAAGSFTLLSLLCSETLALAWKGEGLPTDRLTTENVVSLRTSAAVGTAVLLLDPAGAATDWLQHHLEENSKAAPFEIAHASDARLLQTVEVAVRFGKALLIRDVNAIQPFMLPLLRREVHQVGGRSVVQVGDRAVDLSEGFRLFLSTRNAALALPPDASSLLTTLAFTVTQSGLESQLLAAALVHEQPQLEERRSELVRTEEAAKVALAQTEDALLVALAESSGSLLDNVPLLESLRTSKDRAAVIAESLEASRAAAAELSRQSDVYAPLASCGARLLFGMTGLAAVNRMYQHSLPAFLRLFRQALAGGSNAGAVEGESHVTRLCRSLEHLVLVSASEGALKADRLVVAMHLAHAARPELFALGGPAGAVDAAWQLLISGTASAGADDVLPPGLPPWSGREASAAFSVLASSYPELVRSLSLADDCWSKWSRLPQPERSFPAGVPALTSSAVRLLLVRVFRPDRLLPAMQAFVCEALQVPSVNFPPTPLAQLASSAPSTTPVLLITSGADPTRELADLASATFGADAGSCYREIAMGGGNSDEALAAVRQASQAGHWLCFKNCHLVSSFLHSLDSELAQLSLSATHPAFRLWLSAECHPGFPVPLLQRCHKVAFEAPPGVRNNIARTYQSWGPNTVSGGSVIRSQMLFLLAWLHGVLQERLKYVPQGWTKAYDFSAADLRAGVGVLDVMLPRGSSSDARLPWAFIHGLMENAVYGGRVDNAFDGRVLRAYLAHALHPEVLAAQRQIAKGLALPASSSAADFVSLLCSMPDADGPALFALPPNIDRSLQRSVAAHVASSLRLIGASADVKEASLAERRSAWAPRLKPLLDLWKRALQATRGPKAQPSSKAISQAADSPIDAFVALECAFASTLLSQVSDDVATVEAFISTGATPPQSTLDVCAALALDSVPASWAAVWGGPSSPVAWLAGLLRRHAALLRCAASGAAGSSLLGSPVVFSDLFRPTALLSALRQLTARTWRTNGQGAPPSVGSLRLVFCWDGGASLRASLAASGIPSLPTATLTKLRLQGAAWDAQRSGFAELHEEDEELQLVPDLVAAWVPASIPDPSAAFTVAGGGSHTSTLSVPLYLSGDRETLVTDVSVPCGSDKARWVLAGAAFFVE